MVFAAVLFFFNADVILFLSAIVILYASWEWSNLAGLQFPYTKFLYCSFIFAIIASLSFLMGADRSLPAFIDTGKSILECLIPWWILAIYLINSYPKGTIFWRNPLVRGVIGLLILIPVWLSLSILISLDHGKLLIAGVIIIVALSDIGAYFVGIRFGKHKLCKNVSPNKTWEGFLGAVIVNVIFATFIGFFFKTNLMNIIILFLLVMITVLSSVIGDLLISMFKRHRGIKDSGNILPGHGGILDRIDGHTMAFPIFTLVFIYSNFQV
jgi:phosphatidate cytidylyltransferase